MVINAPQAMNAADTQVEILDRRGTVIQSVVGRKEVVADEILATIQRRLMQVVPAPPATRFDEDRP